MNYPLKELILQELSLGPKKNQELVASLSQLTKTTPQGIYKALRALKKEEKVVIHKHIVSISSVWLFHEQKRLARIQKTYTIKEKLFQSHSSKTNSITFTFKTLGELDLFWTHAFLSLEEECPAKEESIAIAAHDWFLYSRNQTDSAWVQKHALKDRKVWVVVAYPTRLDKEVIKERKKQSGKLLFYYYGNPLLQDESTYFNIIGPYLIKVKLDTRVAKKLNSFIYAHHKLPLSEKENKEIENIMMEKGVFKITIYKSLQKTDKIRKKLGKIFA